MTINVLITTSSFCPSNLPAELQNDTYHIVYNPYGRKLTEMELIDLIEQFQPVAIIAGTESYSETVLSKVKDLKIISRCGIGVDNINFSVVQKKNITVKVTPSAPIQAVKELTIGFMFNALRNISTNNMEIRNGIWNRKQGKLLCEQTIGIIGLGKIGTEISIFLKNIGCEVIGYDIRQSELSIPGVKEVSFHELLVHSDIISLHVPSTPATFNFISSKEFKLMKKDVVFINTSRGEVVNEDDLFQFLKNNPSAHACLDTYRTEPYTGDLLSLSNATFTSHIGSYTDTTRNQMEKEAALNVVEFLSLEQGIA